MVGAKTGLEWIDYVLISSASFCALLGTMLRIFLGIKYSRLIDEVDKMTTTKNRDLKRCKVKYEKCFAMNQGVANVGAFVDRFMSKLALGPFSYMALFQIGAQLILLAVILMALMICHRILKGDSLLVLLPYYAACFAALYVFLTITLVVNIQEKRTVLKTSLVDYLENHLTARLGSVAPNMAKIRGEVEAEQPGGRVRESGIPVTMDTIKIDRDVVKKVAEKAVDVESGGENTKRNGGAESGCVDKADAVIASTENANLNKNSNTNSYAELTKLLEDFFAV